MDEMGSIVNNKTQMSCTGVSRGQKTAWTFGAAHPCPERGFMYAVARIRTCTMTSLASDNQTMEMINKLDYCKFRLLME